MFFQPCEYITYLKLKKKTPHCYVSVKTELHLVFSYSIRAGVPGEVRGRKGPVDFLGPGLML
jgi:hypothetical protein